MINWIKEKWSAHSTAVCLTFTVIILAYLLGSALLPGVVSYLASLIPLAVICVTAIVRANDIGKDKVSKRWQVRRMGLSIVAGASAIAMLGPLAAAAAFPSWMTVALYWGFALVWITTPDTPPWWRWISGRDQVVAGS